MCSGSAARSHMTGPAEICRGPDNPSLRDLRRQVDDAAVDHFVADFLDLLDDRLTGLHELLLTQRTEEAVTALLSIETSGLMVGANQLAAAAAILRRSLAAGNVHRVETLFAQVIAASEHTKAMLNGR